MLTRVAASYRGPGDVIFLPYLAGERTPHNDPYARGVFFGMNADASAETLVQAVLDGVALSVAEAQDLLLQAATRVDRVAAIGGGSRSRFWMQILANALDRPVVLYREGAQGPAFGAARLAQLAVTKRSVEEVCAVPAVAETIEPEPGLVDAYRAAGQKFRRLYRAVKEEFRS
jgi:xylulokinase